MSLYYPSLSWPQTERIWESQLRRISEQNSSIDGDKAELLRYAKHLFSEQENKKELGPVWNGRQIRNAFQTAIALAKFNVGEGQRVRIKKEHFEKVALVSHHFNNYVWRVKKGHTDSDLAGTNMSRADNYDPTSLSTILQQPAYQGLPPRATFGQTHAQVPSPSMFQGFNVPQQQQMYPTNSALPVSSQQYVNSPAYPGQVPQGYMLNPQLQGQPSHLQQFHQPGFAPNQFVGGVQQQQLQQQQPQQPQQQQEQPVLGQQNSFYHGSLPLQQSLPPNSSMQGTATTQKFAQTQQLSQRQQSVQTQQHQ